MSHYSVAVISETGSEEEIERIMAPYQENNMENCPKRFLEFVSVEEKARIAYETGTQTMVLTPERLLLWPQDDRFLVSNGTPFMKSYNHPKEWEREVPNKELYSTYEKFMEAYYGYSERDPEKGEYGYWENPNAKWDYWRIGGRFCRILNAKEGERKMLSWEFTQTEELPDKNGFDSARIGDVDFSIVEAEYQDALRYWEVVVEHAPILPSEDEKSFMCFYGEQYYKDRYHDKETYAQAQASFSTFAVVTIDGEWHEPSKMGWFGLSSESHEDGLNWQLNFVRDYIEKTPEDYYITIVDCHI